MTNPGMFVTLICSGCNKEEHFKNILNIAGLEGELIEKGYKREDDNWYCLSCSSEPELTVTFYDHTYYAVYTGNRVMLYELVNYKIKVIELFDQSQNGTTAENERETYQDVFNSIYAYYVRTMNNVG